jgi:hypothetical protein
MPYIKLAGRNRFENLLHQVVQTMPSDAGELNYLISRIVDTYIQVKSKNYANLNEVIGVLECVKQEYYRRIISVYENSKMAESGDVYGFLPQKQEK